MRRIFVALRRASKNHLVLHRLCIFLRQAFDGYQVLPIDARQASNDHARALRQSTALQQWSLRITVVSPLPTLAMSWRLIVDVIPRESRIRG
jgi:hypothetical protein